MKKIERTYGLKCPHHTNNGGTCGPSKAGYCDDIEGCKELMEDMDKLGD